MGQSKETSLVSGHGGLRWTDTDVGTETRNMTGGRKTTLNLEGLWRLKMIEG